MDRFATVGLCAAMLICAPCARAEDGAMGGTLDARRNAATVDANGAFASPPLTVECRVRLMGAGAYNILVAHEPKSSPAHWEIFTMPASGHLTAYLPGNRPDHARSSASIADGKWHWVAMVLEADRVRLMLDGKQVSAIPYTRPANQAHANGPVTFGSLAEGGLGCDGLIDEVRISNVARPIAAAPTAPLPADGQTIGLWRFDKPRADGAFPDASAAARPAAVRPIAAAAPTPRGQRPAGGQVGVIPPASDVPALRAALTKALTTLKLPALASAAESRDALLIEWDEQYWHMTNRLAGRERLPGPAEQAFDRQALCLPEDGDALGVVLRRTRVLLDDLRARPGAAAALADEARDLVALQAAADAVATSDVATRKGFFLVGCALRRRIAMANPLLDFDRVLFVARGVANGSRLGGQQGTNDRQGQHFHTQYYGFNALLGGGLYCVENFKTAPRVVNLVKDSVVAAPGRLAGRKLAGGSYLSPDLSYDGRRVLFSWTENAAYNSYTWTNRTTWSVFRVGIDGSGLTQLTDGNSDDFDATWLPDGRIAFISERRGGYIRCFGGLDVPQHSLHGMDADGTGVRPLSFFETGEWQPSVNNDGLLVYTRWDYVDRENCLGSNFWICRPDGSDPRAPHGNYPYPWHTFPDNRRTDSRAGRPYTEMNIRAIPGSPRYVLTAAPHHGEAFGSLCVLDLGGGDDGSMSQLRRLTPYVRFPEAEQPARLQYPYGTAWPLSEDYYLCNYWENLYLLDRFGNRVLLCENSLVFDGKTNWDMRLLDPIPVRARPRPPVVPPRTMAGRTEEAAAPAADGATLAVLNVYDADQPLPAGTKIRYLRVVQDVPKSNPQMDSPRNMGYHWENTPRIPLGIVPVEADGSAYFQAPVERELIFQVLDANFMAVQSMRSVAYVHRGERLVCQGCHENPHTAPAAAAVPLALRREPSPLTPEVGAVEPITFYRLVQPTFEKTCAPCHRTRAQGPADMSYEKLRPYVYYFSGGMRGSLTNPVHGGSRSIPGRMGARNSRMGQAMPRHLAEKRIPADAYRRVVLWLDCNAMRLGAFHDEAGQVAGKLVWPKLDVDPNNPQGLDRPAAPRPGQASGRVMGRNRTFPAGPEVAASTACR